MTCKRKQSRKKSNETHMEFLKKMLEALKFKITVYFSGFVCQFFLCVCTTSVTEGEVAGVKLV